LFVQTYVDQCVSRQALADIHEFAGRNRNLPWLGCIFERDASDQFDFQVCPGKRQLLSLDHQQDIGKHRQRLTAFDDASDQLQRFQQGFARNGEMHEV